MVRVTKKYCNNKDFYDALVVYFDRCKEFRERNQPIPIVPNYIAECIMAISKNYATKPKFSGYSFREDFCMDGVENCLRYLHSFNPAKSNQPFSYFTQICNNAFIRRIMLEKKQGYIKDLIFENEVVTESLFMEESVSKEINDVLDSEQKNERMVGYENYLAKKKEKSQAKKPSKKSLT